MINKIYKSVLITGASSGIGLETLKRFFKEKINSYSKTNNGSTEGICGVISDFNWSFDPSSKSYKCEITVDSPGKAYVSGPINVAPKKVTAGCKSGGMLDDGSGQWMKIVLKDMAESQIKKSKVWNSYNERFSYFLWTF